jgi:probable HAF family extracellular repeat protein
MTLTRPFLGAAVLTAALLTATSAGVTRTTATAACSPSATILKSPRAQSQEVQAKAINDRGDVVGFADSNNGSGKIHAILWKGGKAAGAVDLGVLPGYIASEAYGINDNRVVFGLLYDKRERTVPFRWENGRMTVLKGPNGRLIYSDNPGSGGRNAINARGEMAWTMIVDGNQRAVRWTPDGTASYLPGLPGHKWTNTFGINDAGIVSGWSRRLPNGDDEENPVLWTRDGKVVPMKTVPGQSDGIAEATNSSGLTVGYLGNQTEAVPERDQFAVWSSRSAAPKLLGPLRDNVIAEFADVNDRGETIGMTGTINQKTGFISGAHSFVWRPGWAAVRQLAVPAASRKANPVLLPQLNDINDRGEIVGTVYGLTANEFSALRRIDPVVWRCQFEG